MEKIKVLVLDTGDAVQVCLETPEMTTCEALDADQALELLQVEDPEVMVCNLQAPGADLGLISRIKSACPGVQVVVLTPKEDAELAAKAKDLGAFEVIAGPVEPGLLTKVINNAAELGRALDKGIEAARLAEGGDYEGVRKLILDED